MFFLISEKFAQIKTAILAACDALISSEELLNELDRGSGDGDCGKTMKRGAQGKKGLWECIEGT